MKTLESHKTYQLVAEKLIKRILDYLLNSAVSAIQKLITRE